MNATTEELKRRLAALAAIEQGGGDISGERPMDDLPDFEPEVSAPRTPILGARTVEVDVSPQRDTELDDAGALDEESMRRRLFETATRQLVGGLTRTPTQATLTQETHKKSELLGQRRQARMDALRQVEAGNNADRTAAYLKANEGAGPRADRKLSLEEQEAASRGERAKAQRDMDSAKFDETKRHNKQSEGIGWTNANKKPGGEIAERKQEMRENALKPRDDWEAIEGASPTFRDPNQAKSFDDSVAAMGAIRNHRDHVLHEVEALKKAKTPGEADIIVGRLNAQLGALASKLRDAEGLNNTDASNQAVENMLSLSHGSAINWKNVLNEGRLPAILDAAVSSGAANLDTLGQSRNLRRKKAPAVAAQPAASQRKTLKDGRVVEKHADGLWYPVEE